MKSPGFNAVKCLVVFSIFLLSSCGAIASKTNNSVTEENGAISSQLRSEKAYHKEIKYQKIP